MRKIAFPQGDRAGSTEGRPGLQIKRKSQPTQAEDEAGAGAGAQAGVGDAEAGECVVGQADGDRARLCCDITRDRHRRLRLYAAMNDTTIVRVIERLIDEYCAA